MVLCITAGDPDRTYYSVARQAPTLQAPTGPDLVIIHFPRYVLRL